MKKILILCLLIVFVSITSISCSDDSTISGLHINSKTIRLESDMSKVISVVLTPDDALETDYELISENEFVAVCDENSVRAINEGETYIYAASKDGKVISNKVKVIVNNEIFEVAAKIITLSESKTDKELSEVEITPQKASQITETKIYEIPEVFTPPNLTENNYSDTVYITKSGNKFHKQTCSYVKNASPVPRSEAFDKGMSPCQKCKP